MVVVPVAADGHFPLSTWRDKLRIATEENAQIGSQYTITFERDVGSGSHYKLATDPLVLGHIPF